jgi:hypothetical protein
LAAAAKIADSVNNSTMHMLYPDTTFYFTLAMDEKNGSKMEIFDSKSGAKYLVNAMMFEKGSKPSNEFKKFVEKQKKAGFEVYFGLDSVVIPDPYKSLVTNIRVSVRYSRPDALLHHNISYIKWAEARFSKPFFDDLDKLDKQMYNKVEDCKIMAYAIVNSQLITQHLKDFREDCIDTADLCDSIVQLAKTEIDREYVL